MIKKYFTQKHLIYYNIFLTLAALFLYLFSPMHYNHTYILITVFLFLVQAVPFTLLVSNGNYVNFYTLFFTSFFFINFFYASVVYPINPYLLWIFSVPFNHDYITKGTALALLASGCFITGASFKYKKNNNLLIISKNYTGVQKTSFLITLLFLLFLAVVGPAFLSGSFTGASTISTYVLLLLTCVMLLASILYFKQWRYNSNFTKVIFWSVNLFYIFLFLRVGDRGPALLQILLLFGLYAVYVKPIPKRYLAILGISGILMMQIIGLGRVSDTNVEGTIVSRGVEKALNSNVLALTSSFIVNSRNLYVGLEYVDNEGINYGETYITYLLSPIPFGQRTFIAITGEHITGSATFFTELAFSNNASFGLGTNLVADVYIAFGLTGVILMFGLLGSFIENYRNKLQRDGLHIDIIYFSMLMYAVYLPRASMLTPLNIIVWTIALSYLLRRIKVVLPYYRTYKLKFNNLKE
ncbi:O-antigen polysaccharide polymerase Wzy [Rhodohalobacter sp. 614A]|uniref:O-antigen polysaccharide polymerase Wzy n=1 Tax=Rhodohalobacter sp. 614A TaxID=2908649 RepID=UPI001F38040F|nr:O-antigen polysaccharide polymerase Wzy [Rhodohalobacter sp. 614A]